ncbi:2-oxo-4-hydroxy-4-carboxy-5-ureidoimidazoline decarboxylase [Patulibacter sp. NPDC049589]|uniref:2-oxo-4-hydroxy-4-carboxy-5-ureidoimidazoline decarboxylase n=1 Tax=Patulibacter sp. NPDC049589 TaxID=3154731 RepID=UPI00343E26CA
MSTVPPTDGPPSPAPPPTATLPELDREAFVDRFGGVVEDSPWVAEAAWEAGPFSDVVALHDAFERVLLHAGEQLQRRVLLAHPELAVSGGVDAATLSEESAGEQRGAGLDRLAAARRDALAVALRTYRDRFGFPFVACVRDHGGAGLEELLASRVDAAPDDELRTALREVSAIARHRLEDLCA